MVGNARLALSRLLFTQPATPWLPVLVYGPLASAGVIWAIVEGRLPLWALVTLPLVGLLLWTFLEYVFHSIAFHYSVSLLRLETIQASHTRHHEQPSNPRYMVSQLGFTLPVAVVLFAGLWLMLGGAAASLVVAGAMLGYLAYEVVHCAIHKKPRPRWLPRRLIKYHLYHHYKDRTRCFGVTSPLWDWLLWTNCRRNGTARLANGISRPSPSDARTA